MDDRERDQDIYLREFERNLMVFVSDDTHPPARRLMVEWLRNSGEVETSANSLQSWAANNGKNPFWTGIAIIEAAMTLTNESLNPEMRDIDEDQLFRS